MRTTALLLAPVAAALALSACSHPSNPQPRPTVDRAKDVGPPPPPPPTADPVPDIAPQEIRTDAAAWNELDQLISEEKFEAAAKRARDIRVAARAAGNEGEQTLALVREVQLRTALHGYETAVRLLREEPWPENPLWRAALDLYYANQLATYYRRYSWEISRREKVATKEELDLKLWTKDEIFAGAQTAFERVWRLRAALGNLPVEQLADFLNLNNYPSGIRSTLRDSVSYLRVDLLADTAGWRPEHHNDLFRLDVARLIRGDPAASAAVKLDDPNVHPLVKIGAILDDLESWHASAGRAEAALEARLERLRRLHAVLTNEHDRAAIRRDLEERLPKLADVPWWSMGMAVLAELVNAEGAPDSRARAREIALEAAERYPQSPGAARCRHLVATIEAPSYQLSSMANDGPKKRSLLVTHRNLPALWLRAYRFDLQAQLSKPQRRSLLPDGEDLRVALRDQKPVASWKAELSPTPDYRDHRTYVTPPLTEPGAYLVVASAREDFSTTNNSLSGYPFVLTGLVMVSSTHSDRIEVTVLSGQTGLPVPGAKVTRYRYDWNAGHEPLETLTTGNDGTVAFSTGQQNRASFLFAKKGADFTVDPDYLYTYSRRQPHEQRATLVYTDRSIYRPQQKVLWKVVAYGGRSDEAQFRTLPNTSVNVSLIDGNHQVVEKKQVTTNDFGSAAGEFTIPKGRALGSWRITTSPSGGAQIRVEEYKRPTFEVSLKDPRAPLRLNREATLTGEARYYFGLPVVSGSATWKVVRTPVYRWWWYQPPAQQQVIATGVSPLQADGTFRLTFTPEADERQKDKPGVTFRYEVSADVVDEGGETRSASRSFNLGFVSVDATIQAEQAFFTSDEPIALTVLRTDLSGVPRAGKGAWELFPLAQPEKTSAPADLPVPDSLEEQGFRSPGDALRPRFNPSYSPEAAMRAWKDGARKASGSLEHDEKGLAKLQLPKLAPGAYRLRYRTADDEGAELATQHELVVAGPKLPLALPAILSARQTSVRAGEKLQVLAHSGLARQQMRLEIFRSGERVSQRTLRAGSQPSLIELPVTDKDRGGFVIRLTTVTDWQLVHLERSVFVPWDDKELKVEFASFRDRLRPGTGETWRVSVQGPAGKALERGAAELLAYMYDRSLDLFAPHAPPNPLNLYPQRAFAGRLDSSLGNAQILWIGGSSFGALPGFRQFRPDSLKSFDPYGIGGPGVRSHRYRMMKNGLVGDAAPMPAPAMAARESAGVTNLEQKAEPAPASASVLGGMVAASDKATAESAGPQPELRSNFSETAFWQPQLLATADGTAALEFTVPDSVTSWKVWVHALTRDLKAGSANREAQSLKELMVRPYLPRFVREGDEARLKVVVNNAADRALDGQVVFDIVDPETGESVRARYGVEDGAATVAFSAPKGGSAKVGFPIRVPNGVGQIAFKVTAVSGDFSDGELRPLPVLPSRVRLAQSRFATLKDKAQRTLTFEDLARSGDETLINEALVVTLDAQLFYSVLSALPYLVRYPYECTEQTLNRFVSTGIVSSLFDRYPAIGQMAKEFAKRDTQFETFDATDPNRKLTLEESPWLLAAKGGPEKSDDLVNVLDPRIAKAEREAALAKLQKAQTASGGFPWWPGGPPSPYMTLYIAYGLSKAVEFNVEVPKPLVQRAWAYLGEHFRREYQSRLGDLNRGAEFLTFLNYAASCYPDDSWLGGAITLDERRMMLDHSFAHWRDLAPYTKGQLALTLMRMDRPKDAKLVFDAVMDSAKTTEDEGTFWAPEDRAWLWYNDTIETHAFALRTLAELNPKDPRRDGLVHWLMLNKKLNHWKSTRATAEVIYSLVHYLKAEGQLGVRERAAVKIGPRTSSFVFEPDKYTGKKNQIVVAGEELDPKTMSSILVEKDTPGLMFASATWHFSTEKPPAEERGDLLWVSRSYFKRETKGREATLTPLAEGAALKPGDEIEVHLSLRARHPAEYVHLRDPRAAGFEPVSSTSRFKWDLGLGYYEEIRDSSTNFFFEQLPQGEYTFKYRLRAATAGTFKVGPATVQSMYAPEFVAYSTGATIGIEAQGASK
ncbi:MAG: alpha-2-macroglobulin family protein [Myxococcales bacterium]|jgi:hypothetical protein